MPVVARGDQIGQEDSSLARMGVEACRAQRRAVAVGDNPADEELAGGAGTLRQSVTGRRRLRVLLG